MKKKPLFPVGEGYAYTDAGYLVLGRLIEAATGDSTTIYCKSGFWCRSSSAR